MSQYVQKYNNSSHKCRFLLTLKIQLYTVINNYKNSTPLCDVYCTITYRDVNSREKRNTDIKIS